MDQNQEVAMVSVDVIARRIFLIRDKKVMFDKDLAVLYGVKTKVLMQAVKRNIERFPVDFMFQLTGNEFRNWRSQLVTSNSDKMGLRRPPYVFTEQGVAMLSSVLRSKQAVLVHIQIIRAFVQMRELLLSNQSLRLRIDALEKRYDAQFKTIFDAMRRLISEENDVKKANIGFRTDV